MSDLSKDAGYLGDLDTSSSEPHSSGSEDDISIASKKGISLFISDHFTNTPQTMYSIGSKIFFATSLNLPTPKVTIATQNCFVLSKTKNCTKLMLLIFFFIFPMMSL